MTATVTRTTKTVINLSSITTILFTNIATEDARKTTIFSNRFMNFKIQLQKILSLLVLAIERQLKLKCRYHTWTPVVTLERVTLHLLTFWHFDTGNGFSVPGSGSGGSRGGTGGGGGGLPLIFRSNWGPKGQQNFFWDHPPPPYLRVWMIPPLSEGLYPPPGAHNPPPLSRLIEFRFEILVTGSPLLLPPIFNRSRWFHCSLAFPLVRTDRLCQEERPF